MTSLRRLALTAHVVFSVGWLGAVAAFLALAVGGLAGDEGSARAAYVAMELVTWAVIVPLAVASLLSGIVQGLLSKWGLLRHWWVVVKLLLTLFATAVLLLHTQPIDVLADGAAAGTLGEGDEDRLRVQLLADAVAALLVLLLAAGLSVFKPRGLTRYGWRRQRVSAS